MMTKGPWRIESLPICPDEWAICGPDTASVGMTMGCVYAKHPNAKSNARAIVACPDLIESLEEMTNMFEGLARSVLRDKYTQSEAEKRARAILAAVEGEK